MFYIQRLFDSRKARDIFANTRFRLLYIMNIPSPYRWHLFSVLHNLCKSREVFFKVAFLAEGSRIRQWKIAEFSRSFNFEVSRGINFSTEDVRMFNPGLVLRLLTQTWDWIIFGGYDNPTNALLLSFPLPNTGVKIIRNEGNLQASRNLTGVISSMKRFLLSRCGAYLVPGQRGREWLDYWQPKRGEKPVHVFPNVVDDENLLKELVQLRQNRRLLMSKYNLGEGKRVFFTAARLSPEKGLSGFIRHLPNDFRRKNVLLIAGDGPMQKELGQLINDCGLSDGVRLLGYIHHSQIAELYAIADIFVLPSLLDHNPLSVIEASFAGLPLILSKRIGNYPEALKEGITGWGFDPLNGEEITSAVRKAAEMSGEHLRIMGENCSTMAQNHFRSDVACNQLLDFLLSIHPSLRERGVSNRTNFL